MPLKRVLYFCSFLAALFSTGCARVSTMSVVHSDGSYKRTVTYRVNEPAATADPGSSGAPGTQKFEDVAALPHGAEWKVARSKEESTTVVAATRDAAPGTSIAGDLGLKAGDSAGPEGKSAPIILNKVTVSKTPDGHLEYRETLHWNGKLDEELAKPDLKVVAGIKATLPAALRNDTKAIDALAVVMQGNLWETLFGAPKALFSEFLLNTDYAIYEVTRRMQPAFDKALKDQFGARLSDTQRSASVASLLNTVMNSVSDKTKPEAAQSNTNLNISSLFYRVQLPGKVVATNGELNESNNEVVWSLYSLGPAAKDVVLTATCEAK